MSTTPHLLRTLWDSGITQPDLIFNDALRLLDCLVAGILKSRTTDAEPGSPTEGDAYIITGSASGTDWATFDEHDIAVYSGAAWIQYAPMGRVTFMVDDESDKFIFWDGAAWVSVIQLESFIVAVSDEASDLAAGTATITFRMPYAFTLSAVRANVNTAPTDADIIVDINEGGSTILSTKLSIDATEKTSTTAATPPVISDTALADDAEMTIDIDQVGSTIPGKGLKVILIGKQTT